MPWVPLEVGPVCPPHKGGNVPNGRAHRDLPGTSHCQIKPTIYAAEFVHQAGQYQAQLAVKEVAATPPSVEPSVQSGDLALHSVMSPMVMLLPSEALSSEQQVDPALHPATSPAASPAVTSLPSTTDISASSSDIDPVCASLPVPPPLADLPTTRPLHIVKAQINPMLLALSTALTFNLEMAGEDRNASPIPPPPSFLAGDIPIAGVVTAHISTANISPTDIPTGDVPEGKDNQSTPSTPTAGRQTAHINSILAACYYELNKILMKATGETSCSVQQVLDSWNKSCGQVICAMNHWNLWPSYLVKHENKECLCAGVPMDVPCKFLIQISCVFHDLTSHTVTPTLCGHLYATFKEVNHNNWQEILEIHSMLELSKSASLMVSQCTQTFNNVHRQAVSLVSLYPLFQIALTFSLA